VLVFPFCFIVLAILGNGRQKKLLHLFVFLDLFVNPMKQSVERDASLATYGS